EYHYDPATDVLEQLRDKVAIGFVDGSCVVQSREAVPAQLVRVDRVDDTVERSAPVGRVAIPSKNVKNVKRRPEPQRKGKGITPDPKAALMEKTREQRMKRVPQKTPEAPPTPPLKPAPQQTVAPQAKNVGGPPAGSYTHPSTPARTTAQDTSQVQTQKK